MAATSATSTNNSQRSSPPKPQESPPPPKQDFSCRSCVRLVNEILQDANSRPRQVLQALVGGLQQQQQREQQSLQQQNKQQPVHQQQQQQQQHQEQPSFQLHPSKDGIQIDLRIPDLPLVLFREWRKLEPPVVLVAEDTETNTVAANTAATDKSTKRSFFFSSSSNNNNNNKNNHNHNSSSSSNRQGPPLLATSSSSLLTPHEEGVDANAPLQPTIKDLQKPIPYKTETIRVECRPCQTTGPEQGARALLMGPTPLSIVACTNRITPNDREEMTQILVHELVHAYDVQRLRLDLGDCESVAYSEVRAAREAECYRGLGDGTGPRDGSNNSSSSTWTMSAPAFLTDFCVKQKAIAATQNIFPDRGRTCVRTVFDQASKDPRPFSKADLQRWSNHKK